MHLWPWNSIANRILLRWRFAESLVNWNGTIQTLEHLQTNKQTDTETDADEISTASLRGGNNDNIEKKWHKVRRAILIYLHLRWAINQEHFS